MNRSANILITLLAIATTAYAQNTALFWSAFDQGFATSQSSSTMAKSAAGQAIVGKLPASEHAGRERLPRQSLAAWNRRGSQ